MELVPYRKSKLDLDLEVGDIRECVVCFQREVSSESSCAMWLRCGFYMVTDIGLRSLFTTFMMEGEFCKVKET